MFYINLPIGLIALPGSLLVTLAEGERRQGRELDLLGLTTMASFVVTLMLAVSQARLYGWGSTYILTLLGIAAAFCWPLWWPNSTCEAPMVHLQVFGNGQFVLGALANFCESFTNFAMNFIVALFLQQGLGLSPRMPGSCCYRRRVSGG